MREISITQIIEAVRKLCMDANYRLGEDVLGAFKRGLKTEESPNGKAIFEALLENAEIAKTEQVPMCQDTGITVVFLEVGQEVHITGGSLNDAINDGVRKGYEDGYLRKSICDPFTRINTNTNTPAVIITDIVDGDIFKITIAPKGGGSENMSRVTMLTPSGGKNAIMDFVVQRCQEAGSNPCPPVIVAVAIGGTPEKAAILAKRALLRDIGSENPDLELKEMESELLVRINNLGIGPQGLGGRNYALAVHIIKHPCHIATLPLAVNLCCHASRHKEMVL
ncbi:MAG TPA: fumarate hydratase [Nitrospinota bacterium]|jgi:fumarate hydratase subunit alpha|nr:fumarate hydratase [Nitrospinota bacterium]|tara:strand:- start:9597 stop:10436 length:840 start_codon:yes stop_codon:yes gene_type:complete